MGGWRRVAGPSVVPAVLKRLVELLRLPGMPAGKLITASAPTGTECAPAATGLSRQRPAVQLEGVELDQKEMGGIGMEPALASMP